MPSYRPINDTEVAVDAPLTQQLMQALKDNVLAIQEGATGAPKIASNAFPCVAGNIQVIGDSINTGLVYGTTASDIDSATYTFNRSGTVKIYFRVAIADNEEEDGEGDYENSTIPHITYVGRIYINSSLVASTQAVNRSDGLNVFRLASLASQNVSVGDTLFFRMDRTDSVNSNDYRAQFVSEFGVGIANDPTLVAQAPNSVLASI